VGAGPEPRPRAFILDVLPQVSATLKKKGIRRLNSHSRYKCQNARTALASRSYLYQKRKIAVGFETPPGQRAQVGPCQCGEVVK
jgi:hypothetical protein